MSDKEYKFNLNLSNDIDSISKEGDKFVIVLINGEEYPCNRYSLGYPVMELVFNLCDKIKHLEKMIDENNLSVAKSLSVLADNIDC